VQIISLLQQLALDAASEDPDCIFTSVALRMCARDGRRWRRVTIDDPSHHVPM
jgi:hypothetical protein